MIAGYEIVKKLVEGETAVVYLARPEQGMDYAIALVMRPDVAADTTASLRFMMEVETAKALQHPHLLRWVDDGALDDGRPYLLSEPVAENVATLLDVRGPQSPQEGLALAAQVASALEYLHGQRVFHGLLSPTSVFLSPTEIPQVKVVDLSLAVRKLDGTFPAAKLAPEYLAPEVIRGGAPGAAADVYGVGLLLYEILVGSPLFAGKDKEQIRKRQVEEQPALPPDKLGDAAAIVKRCLQKGPEQRYPSALALREVLVPKAAAAAPVASPAPGDGAELEPLDPTADYGDEPVTRIQSIAALRAQAVPPPPPPPAQIPGSVPVHLSEPPRPAPAVALVPEPEPAARVRKKKSKLLIGLGIGAAMLVSAGVGVVTALPGGIAALVPASAPVSAAPAVDPKPAAPAPDPTPAEPKPADPPADPKPADPAPAKPAADPRSADPKPEEPPPADSKPAEPANAAALKPADPAPTPEPKPEEPKPAEKPATADILLTSAPTGATVERFDTKTRMGRTPMSVTVQRDAELTLTISVDGYVPMMVKLNVDSPNPTQVLLDKVGAEKPAPAPRPKPKPKPKVNKDVQLDPFGN